MTYSARNLTRLQRRRLSWRIARGMTLSEAGKPVGLNEVDAEDLLTDGHFPLLVEAYRALEALPEHARRRRLLQLAIAVLEQAAMSFDMRVAMFVTRQESLGRDAAEVLTDGVIRSLERRDPERRPPDGSAPSTPPPSEPRPPCCPADSAIYRAAASLRSEVMDEFEMRSAAAMGGTFSTAAPARNEARQPRRTAPAEPAREMDRAESETDASANRPKDEKPRTARAASPPHRIPEIRVDRLNERQLQYLADLGLARSLATAPPVRDGPDDPNEPDTD